MPKNELLANAERLDLETLENRTEFLEVTCDYKGNCEETSDKPQ
jgi:hypothetical protein